MIADMPPRAQRTSVMLRAQVRDANDGAPSAHRVVNISATGLCLTDGAALTTGTGVLVTVGAAAAVPAEVVWVHGGLAGLRLRAAIDMAAARRRPATAANAPSAGWMTHIDSPYRRRG